MSIARRRMRLVLPKTSRKEENFSLWFSALQTSISLNFAQFTASTA